MKSISIQQTAKTPHVEFNNNGELRIEGRSFSEDPRSFYQPLMDWVQNLEVSEVTINVKLDYMNTSSTKMMNEFMKMVDANAKISTKVVHWYYEEEDEDILEVGQFYEENTMATQFFFLEMAA